MIYFILFLVAFILIWTFRNYRIKFSTFFEKGFVPNNDKFGIYCYCGKQGKGKTYSVVEFLSDLPKETKIFANLKSLKNIEYKYINGFKELLELESEHDCIIVYDEIFTALTKNDRVTKEVLSFLSQMRKRRIIFITTAQEWLEIHLTFRRYCRYQIDCNMRSFFGVIGILFKSYYDVELMKYDKDAMEYIAPLELRSITKCRLRIASNYDTYEQIST